MYHKLVQCRLVTLACCDSFRVKLNKVSEIFVSVRIAKKSTKNLCRLCFSADHDDARNRIYVQNLLITAYGADLTFLRALGVGGGGVIIWKRLHISSTHFPGRHLIYQFLLKKT